MPSTRRSGRAATRSRSRSGSRAVRSGLEALGARRFAPLRGLRVGLVCNPTAVTRGLAHAADLLAAAPGVSLGALLGPEHGVRGDAQYMVAVGGEPRDPRTGALVHSLYGETAASLAPTPAALAGLDALVFDIQDVGARYYTYQATMMLCMEAAARAGIAFFVLDRPNPIGGAVEGPRLLPGFESFCGLHDLAVRHGMTVGELARLFRAERGLDLALTVIPCEGWRRALRFRDTGLPWVYPSPNMPTPETALVYPGMCLLEGTNLSEGRGTTRPFELFGAPWLDPHRLAADLARERLPGVGFRPASFVPTWDKHAGVRCHGVDLVVADPDRFRPFRTALACVLHARAQDPARFRWRTEPYEFVKDVLAFDLLCGSDRERRAIEAGATLAELCRPLPAEERAFERRRREYLIYQ